MWKITNKKNLPKAFINMALADQKDHTFKPKNYSATTIMEPILPMLLERRHDIEVDVSDLIWMLFGQAVHHILEFHDDTGNSEIRLEYDMGNGYKLTGKFDLYNEEDYSLEDYKTATTWKVLKGDTEEWRIQGLIYAWLLKKVMLKHVSQLKFHALLKDWSQSEKTRQGPNYPDSPVWTWHYKVQANDFVEIEEYIHERFRLIKKYEPFPDNLLPICTKEERWARDDTYAVYKNGSSRATRVFGNEKEAEDWVREKSMISYDNYHIQKREGEDIRCENYCSYKSVCPYMKMKKGGKIWEDQF